MKVLGMRALGVHASSAIQAVALLIATGNDNVIIGYQADPSSDAATNQIVIGSGVIFAPKWKDIEIDDEGNREEFNNYVYASQLKTGLF